MSQVHLSNMQKTVVASSISFSPAVVGTIFSILYMMELLLYRPIRVAIDRQMLFMLYFHPYGIRNRQAGEDSGEAISSP